MGVCQIGESSDEAVEGDAVSASPVIEEDAYWRAIKKLAGGTAKSTREMNPVNEFTTKDILAKTFPGTFMLGRAYPNKGVRLGSRELNHLFHQFTNVPAEDFRLLGYLGDVISRFDVMKGVVAHVKSCPGAKAQMNELINSEEKQKELLQAKDNPETEHAKKVMKQYFPHMNFSGKDVNAGMFESFRLKSMLFETCKRHCAPASSFLTLALGNVDNPRVFRSTFHSINNETFPAKFDEACQFGTTPEEFIRMLREDSVLTATHYALRNTAFTWSVSTA